MERIILRRRSKEHTEQYEFALDALSDILVGRDAGVDIRLDAEELVSRRHARITREPGTPPRLVIADLLSRNGTYVNGQRITGAVTLSHGDVVQFGRGGPELEVVVDPPPPPALPALTRVAGTGMVASTQPAQNAPAQVSWRPAPNGVAPGKRGLGRATIERLIGETSAVSRRRAVWLAAAVAGVAVTVGVVVAYTGLRRNERLATDIANARSVAESVASRSGMSTREIAATFTDVNVMIEGGWKLIYAPTGEQVYHQYVVEQDRRGRPVTGDDGQMKRAPLYLRLPDGSIEPSLVLDKGEFAENVAVGGLGRGSGFVVTAEGFIMTNGHVAAPWDRENYWSSLGPGLLLDLSTRKYSRVERIPRWIPTQTRLLGQKPLEERLLAGRHDYLDVTFSRRSMRLPASLVRVSDKHDVALIKVEVVEPLKKVELLDNYDDVSAGVSVTVMGFPGSSANPVTVSRSRDFLAPVSKVVSVPDPTVTPGVISRVFRAGPVQTAAGTDAYASQLGEAYQLTANPGPGNSGGPVFDDRGRVIAVFYAGSSKMALAVPIRYGIELMGTGSVVTH